LELIKKENENIMQKLLKRHNDEIVALTASHEHEIRGLAEEKRVFIYMERVNELEND